VPKIEDPEPDGTDNAQGYWLAVNFIAQASGTKQTVLQSITLERIRPTDGIPGVAASDLKDIYPAIASYITDNQLGAFLSIAQDEVRAELESKGFDWTRLFTLSKLALPIAYKTIALAALSQIKEPGDKWELRFNTFSERYDQISKAITMQQDTDLDNAPDELMKPRTTYAVISR